MDREEIIRMAREAGFADSNGIVHAFYQLEYFAYLVAEHEREAIWNLLFEYAGRDDLSDSDQSLLKHLLDLIAARWQEWSNKEGEEHMKKELTEPRAWFTVDELNAWADKKLKENPQWAEKPAQQQEPVATVTSESGNPNLSMSWWHEPALPVGTKIYTSPQPNKQWVGLTDEEINSVRHKRDWTAPWTDTTFAHAIEAKLREKNHG